MAARLVRPPRLAPGDKVAVVSPASPPNGRRLLALGTKRLAALGLQSAFGPHVLSEHGYLAGRDTERLADLEAAFRDPGVKAIFCSRGGYGVARFLDAFDPTLARRHPKALVGFSDITVLHLALQKAGLVSFWGPMPCTGSGWTPFSVRALKRALMAAVPAGRLPFAPQRRPRVLRRGIGQGPITGGTLSLLASSLGTPYEIETRGRIVFLEDVGEEPYRVDRLMTQLVSAGKLADAAGIAVGLFTDAAPRHSPGKRTLTLEEVIADRLLPLGVPILANVVVGHVPDQLTLPYGVEARLDAGAKTLEILEAAVV